MARNTVGTKTSQAGAESECIVVAFLAMEQYTLFGHRNEKLFW